MRQSMQAVCMLVVLVGGIVAPLVWLMDRPDPTTWIFRIATPIVVVGAIAAAVRLGKPARPDEVPDYLSGLVDGDFDRGGFCFGFSTDVADGACRITAYFQNQYEGACVGRIALRPTRGFWLNRPAFAEIRFEIDCEPAAFGFARLAVPIPPKLQGKTQAFEVGASVDYPRGRGRRLRFRDGVLLRTNSNFGNAFGTALTIAGAAGGMVVLTEPAIVKLPMPKVLVDDAPFDAVPEVRTLWKLGDPQLVAKTLPSR